eukprot:COSAG01_NODE_9177_length_2529_cov_1.462551_4_plen_75_part_00
MSTTLEPRPTDTIGRALNDRQHCLLLRFLRALFSQISRGAYPPPRGVHSGGGGSAAPPTLDLRRLVVWVRYRVP